MTTEFNEAKRFLGIKFGYGEPIKDGLYAIPTTTSKGDAFMSLQIKDGNPFGNGNFKLYWDEDLHISWYNKPKPENLKQSKFAKLFRQISKEI